MQIGLMMSVLLAAQQMATLPVAGPLAPIRNWAVEYGDNMCMLSNDYGTANDRLALGFRKSALSSNTQLVLITNREARAISDEAGNGIVTIGPSGRTIQATYDIQRPQLQPNVRIVTMLIPTADFGDLANADNITVSARNVPTVALVLKLTNRIKAGLKSCHDDLVREWKTDPEEDDRVAQPATANPASWMSSDDYPAAANGAEGKVTALYKVGIDGLITDCRVVISSGTPILDETACRVIVERARYKPAIGKNGKPMAVHKTISFTFVQPH